PRYVNAVASYGAHLAPESRALVTKPDGSAYAVGDLVKNPAQAALLERLAARGPDSFYVGPEAQRLVATVDTATRNPSKMTTGDLASYDAKPRPPV
ncbi:gamma-glutamyltransferase, partial [Streptococcus suis]